MFKLCLLIVTAALVLGPQAVKAQLVGATNVVDKIPYHAFLLIGDNLFCNGAIISKQHILSAGHCVVWANNFSIPVRALVGTNDRTSGGQSYPVLAQAHYPGFVMKIPEGCIRDIGIFLLRSDIELSDSVRIVGRPTINDIQVGSNAVVTAAGYKSENGPMSKVLQKLTVKIINQTSCSSMMDNKFSIDKTHICTFVGKGRGICRGDSGAPLVRNNVIIGVASGSVPCARGYPDVFTNVYDYLFWIEQMIGE